MRPNQYNAGWSQDEIEKLKELYPHSEIGIILKTLPKRTYAAIMHKANRLNICRLTTIELSKTKFGSLNPMWKGDKAGIGSAHYRARSRYKVPKGYERHHIDGNPYNNNPENIAIVTRKEHQILDGRYARFISFSQVPENHKPVLFHDEKHKKALDKCRRYRAKKKALSNHCTPTKITEPC
jgi:hypothetical protein